MSGELLPAVKDFATAFGLWCIIPLTALIRICAAGFMKSSRQ